MKLILTFVTAFSLFGLDCRAQEPAQASSASVPAIRVDAWKIDLGSTLPEDFDWESYFAKPVGSNLERRERSVAAHRVMKARIDQMCDSYRQELTKRQAQNALEAFNHMQTLWEQAANAEIGFVGSAYEGGSELKTACARHRFRVYLRRVRELSELSKAAHFDK